MNVQMIRKNPVILYNIQGQQAQLGHNPTPCLLPPSSA
jgi:hypothetical protein